MKIKELTPLEKSNLRDEVAKMVTVGLSRDLVPRLAIIKAYEIADEFIKHREEDAVYLTKEDCDCKKKRPVTTYKIDKPVVKNTIKNNVIGIIMVIFLIWGVWSAGSTLWEYLVK